MPKILALDLGTSTGFGIGSVGHIVSGSWNLKPGRFDGGGMRFVKFRARLDEIRQAYGVTHVFFEEVRRHAGTDAAHCYGGLLATLQTWCEEKEIPYQGVPVGTVKKNFTGNGAASKDLMIAECVKRGFEPATHDEADAIAVFDYALRELGLVAEDGTPIETAKLAAE